MVRRKIRLTIPQYRERKEIFESLGYKEVNYIEKGIYCKVTQEIDEHEPYYYELRQFEKRMYAKGPHFGPILLLVIAAFGFLSSFVILLAGQRDKFDLVTNALTLLLPAFLCLLADVIYTYFYFTINKRIIDRGTPTKAEMLKLIEDIKK